MHSSTHFYYKHLFCTFCVCSVLATDKRYGQSLTLVNFASNRPSPCSFLQFCLSGLQVHVLLKCSVWCVWCGHTEAISSHCTLWVTFAVWIIDAHLTPVKPVLSSAVLPPACKAFPFGPSISGVILDCPNPVSPLCHHRLWFHIIAVHREGLRQYWDRTGTFA